MVIEHLIFFLFIMQVVHSLFFEGGPTPASFLFIFMQKIPTQSNRRGRWPLDHYHGPLVTLFLASKMRRPFMMLPLSRPWLQLQPHLCNNDLSAGPVEHVVIVKNLWGIGTSGWSSFRLRSWGWWSYIHSFLWIQPIMIYLKMNEVVNLGINLTWLKKLYTWTSCHRFWSHGSNSNMEVVCPSKFFRVIVPNQI